jgi:hypothetical protein
MINLIHFLIFGQWMCEHHWEEYEKRNMTLKGTVVGQSSYCACTKCGSHKVFGLRAKRQ